MEPFFSFGFSVYWIYSALRDWQKLRRKSWAVRGIAIGCYSLSLILYILFLNDVKLKMPADLFNNWISPIVQRWFEGGGAP